MGGEPSQVGKGHGPAGGLLLQENGGGAAAIHQAREPLASPAEGGLLAILTGAQHPRGPSGAPCPPERSLAALAGHQQHQREGRQS